MPVYVFCVFVCVCVCVCIQAWTKILQALAQAKNAEPIVVPIASKVNKNDAQKDGAAKAGYDDDQEQVQDENKRSQKIKSVSF